MYLLFRIVVGEATKSLQEKSVFSFETKTDRKGAEYHAQIIEKLSAQFNSFKNDPKKIDGNTMNKIYQQTLMHHYAEVKSLKSQIESLDKSMIKTVINRGLETLEENKGHLKLFQDFVLEMIKIQGDSLLPDNERLIKMQLAISHIQQVATRFSFDRINHDIALLRSAVRGIVPDYTPVNILTGSVKDTPLETKYFQQLEKIKTENEILQSKMGVLEATMQEVECNKVPIDQNITYTAKVENRCTRILRNLMSKARDRSSIELLAKIQELNKKIISLTEEISKQQKENGILRKRLLITLP